MPTNSFPYPILKCRSVLSILNIIINKYSPAAFTTPSLCWTVSTVECECGLRRQTTRTILHDVVIERPLRQKCSSRWTSHELWSRVLDSFTPPHCLNGSQVKTCTHGTNTYTRQMSTITSAALPYSQLFVINYYHYSLLSLVHGQNQKIKN